MLTPIDFFLLFLEFLGFNSGKAVFDFDWLSSFPSLNLVNFFLFLPAPSTVLLSLGISISSPNNQLSVSRDETYWLMLYRLISAWLPPNNLIFLVSSYLKLSSWRTSSSSESFNPLAASFAAFSSSRLFSSAFFCSSKILSFLIFSASYALTRIYLLASISFSCYSSISTFWASLII